MKIRILSILYTLLSILFLIVVGLFKGIEYLFSGFIAYGFILFVQYIALVSKGKALLKFIATHTFLNYAILVLGFFYYFIISIMLVNDIVKIAFGYFAFTGSASSCFYTFFMCKKYINKKEKSQKYEKEIQKYKDNEDWEGLSAYMQSIAKDEGIIE